MRDFEIGAYDAELFYSGKLEEWLELRVSQYRTYPTDHGTKCHFAEALLQTERCEDALQYLLRFHTDDSRDEDFNQQILDCLRCLGKKKSDFLVIPELRY